MKSPFTRRRFLETGTRSLGAAALGCALAPFAGAQPAAAEITRLDLGYAWVLQGAGCNVLAVPGRNEGGVLLVDGGLAANAEALLQAAFEATGQDAVHSLINTHWHPEQTGANELVGAQGARIFAHEKTRLCLQN